MISQQDCGHREDDEENTIRISNLIKKDHEITQDCLSAYEQLRNMYTSVVPSDSVSMQRLRGKIISLLRRMIEIKYDLLIEEDLKADPNTEFEDEHHQIVFLIGCLDLTNDVNPLPPGFIKWVIAKLMKTRLSNIVLNPIVANHLESTMLKVAGYLNEEETLLFFKHIIQQLYALTKDHDHFNLFNPSDGSSYYVNIYVGKAASFPSRKIAAYQALLLMLSPHKFEFSCLSSRDVIMLFYSLIQICNVESLSLKNTCVLLLQRLFSMDLSCFVVSCLVMDRLLAIEQLLYDMRSEFSGRHEAHKLKESLLSSSKVMMEKLKEFETCKSFADLDAVWLLKFSIRSSTIALQYSSPPPRLELMVATSCDLLSRLDPTSEVASQPEIQELAQYIKRFVELALSQKDELDKLTFYSSYLLLTDQIAQNKSNATWLIQCCMGKCSEYARLGKHVEEMNIRRNLAAALTRCSHIEAKSIIIQILPSEKDTIQIIETSVKDKRNGSKQLLALLGLLRVQVEDDSSKHTATTAFLSLPWLTNIGLQMDSRRHLSSLPLLKDMVRLAKDAAHIITDEVQEHTIEALSLIKEFSEWRLAILLSALASKRTLPIQAALLHLSGFVSSMNVASFNRIIIATLGLVDLTDWKASHTDVASVLSALCRAICVTSRDEEEEKKEQDEASICNRCQEGIICKSSCILLPDDLFKLILIIMDDPSTEIEIRLYTAELLIVLLCHYERTIDKKNGPIMESSLRFIRDQDEAVRKHYMISLKMIVSVSQPETFINGLKKQLVLDNAGFLSMNAAMEAICPFLTICARFGYEDSDLKLWAFRIHFKAALRLCDADNLLEVFKSFKTLVGQLARDELAEEENQDRCRIFARRYRALSADLLEELLYIGREYKDGSSPDSELDAILDAVKRLFSFPDINSMLTMTPCGLEMVALLMTMEGNGQSCDTMLLVLERIRYHLGKNRQDLIADAFPILLERMDVLMSQEARDRISNFCREYSGSMTLSIMLSGNRYHCNLVALRNMTANEEYYLDFLRTINHKIGANPSLTEIMQHNFEYHGFLLSFRRSIIEDCQYEIRPIILSSLAYLIRNLDPIFLENISNKMMIVLRTATTIGEAAINVWEAFVEQISTKVLVALLPQILISIQPLWQYVSCDELLKLIFHHKGPLEIEQSESFERTAMVVWNGDLDSARIGQYLKKNYSQESKSKVIHACVRMLIEECELVGKVVLQKLMTILDGNPLEDALAAQLVPALLHTLRGCNESEVRHLAVRCLGRLGAVDPGRLALSSELHVTKKNDIIFVDDRDKFYTDLLERCWRVYTNVLDPEVVDVMECALQKLLSKLVGTNDNNNILQNLSEECRRDLEPLKKSTLMFKNEEFANLAIPRPLVDHARSFSCWLSNCFLIGSLKVQQYPMSEVFQILQLIIRSHEPTVFTRHLLPQLIILLILESQMDVVKQYAEEMELVLRRIVEGNCSSWVQHACHVVFSVIDTLERYSIHRLEKKRPNDKELERTRDLLSILVSHQLPNGNLLIVAAAEKCQCMLRALKWCEQYAIDKTSGGADIFSHTNYYTLERIYMELQNVDGVQGAFQYIVKNSQATADESILALEANGDYTEALPLYSQSKQNMELQQVRCLIRLNQPQLALIRADGIEEKEENIGEGMNNLQDAQMEAAWLLKDWTRLDNMLQKRDPLVNAVDTSWGASCASILCSVKKRIASVVENRLRSAREILVNRLTAVTIEDSNTYSQAYPYMTQLSIFEEVEDSIPLLSLMRDSEPKHVSSLLQKWQARSDSAVQCVSVLEPMLRVRRELLAASSGRQVHTAYSQLLLQSSRLARQAGHLQIAWTFLVEAKGLNVNYKDVGLEEARFLFQKGNQSEAIGLLSRLLTERYSSMNDIFSQLVKGGNDNRKVQQTTPETVRSTSIEDRTAYAEVQLLRVEYMQKASYMEPTDLYHQYLALQRLEVPCEDLHYRIAVFFDGMYSRDSEKVRSDLVTNMLLSYQKVLKYGRSHLFHAMPRMLTIWLDVSEKKAEGINTRLNEMIEKLPKDIQAKMKNNNKFSEEKKAELEEKDQQTKIDRNEIAQMNKAMLRAFDQLDLYTFYTAFPQLISRILHPDVEVFAVLKNILAELITKYTHQCLWQSIAVYREGKSEIDKKRKSRCNEIYSVARKKDSRIDCLIDQYDYVSSLLIEIAYKKLASGQHDDFPNRFSKLHEFFSSGKLDTSLLMKSGIKETIKINPTVMIPLTKMLEYALPKDHSVKVNSLSQFHMDVDEVEDIRMESLPEVFINAVNKKFLVLASMQVPKRLSLLGADGKTYMIMVKKEDELRKDARFMDVNRMMNSLMLQNADARRRQLMVRTFTVIPLQSEGGIIEWLPNLSAYRQVLTPLFIEKTGTLMSDREWFDSWKPMKNATIEEKVEKMREIFYPRYPLVMAEWFRRKYPDPNSWHAARISFARSAAVMSMIGFVLGLGDRHGENIQIDLNEGCVVHVDYNLIFNKGESLPVKEVVPFRLTRNMVNGFGPTGVEGSFRKACEATMRVMRDNADTLLTVLHAFVHDPLLEWLKVESRAQQAKVANQNAAPLNVVKQAAENVSNIKKRLEGYIVTPEISRNFLFNSGVPMSIEGQVEKLIERSMNEGQLAAMFTGWAPFM